ncbi:DUF262 domain-containing HNH endonuclease family protein [Micromonospora harpali]|uniref:DUF262 domain-containing HNH endonuclease family protein n=1 Tax=Micromonospora harpali TaxID=1490225 RepID=A0ABW1HLN0_9ACTN
MTTNAKTMAEVFTSYYLRVPRFQRPYEWLDSDIEDFWNDVLQSDRDYFIGSMVVFPSQHGTQGLVDGQQRVTTITLLMCALRDQLKVLDLEDARNAAAGLQNLVERRSVLDNKQHFVLQTDTDNPFLRFIQAGGGGIEPTRAESERRVRAANTKLRNLLRLYLRESAPGTELQRLIEIRDKILELRVVFVEVDNEDDATIIFQTLNSRGRDLEVSDLVKSHVMAAIGAPNPGHDLPRDKWHSMLASFEESEADLSIDRFLLHYWLSIHDYVSGKGLFKPVRLYLHRPTAAESARTAERFLDSLVHEARLYREIHEPDFRAAWLQQELSVRESLKAIQLFRLRQPVPWILAAWSEHQAGRLRLKDTKRAISLIENYHFIATAVSNQPSSGGVSKMYAAHARALRSATTTQARMEVIDDLSEKLAMRIPTFDEFRAKFAEIRSSKTYSQQRALALYILRKLHSSPVTPDFAQLTVEHLAPQGSSRPADLREADVAKLGNLILLPESINGKLDSKQFPAKKSLLRQAVADGVWIDPSVLSAAEWGLKEINERTNAMAIRAYEEVWPVG